MTTASDMMQKGGVHFRAVREWLQWNTKNGDRVTWGSHDVIHPQLTVKEVEEMACHIASAVINEQEKKQLDAHNAAVREAVSLILKSVEETGTSTPDERTFIRHALIHKRNVETLIKPV